MHSTGSASTVSSTLGLEVWAPIWYMTYIQGRFYGSLLYEPLASFKGSGLRAPILKMVCTGVIMPGFMGFQKCGPIHSRVE